MPFNTALSGIRSANDDLRLTGNNIANASTTGFKKSRAEFGDVYSTTVLGSGLNQVGSGVRIQDVAQQFTQGNISFTENVLDLAISGSGFFVTVLDGDETYTRSGTFGLDQDGFIVNNTNYRLQGFIADGNGNVGSIRSDILIQPNSIQPQSTTQVEMETNLDSREEVPQTAFTISAAGVAAIEAAGVDTIQVTGDTGVITTLNLGTAGVDTATTIRDVLNASTGIEAALDDAGTGVEVILTEGFTLTTNTAGNDLTSTTTTSLSSNIGFDPTDPSTYNHSTALTIYDSLGNPHTLQQYFINQPFDPLVPGTANYWQMAVLVDGRNVGAPTNVMDPINTATTASYDLFFNPNGTLNLSSTPDINITNWEPLDENGIEIGAYGPNDTPSSNFDIDLTGSTQVGGGFEIRSVSQDGTTTGRLAGINIDDTGTIFARFTNGQNRVLAQVVLADFPNTQGLQTLGDTSWAETFESGEPIVNIPGAASLGLIQSGALEESNVDLSEQLVNLIIAQRNFQASAKTIETADQTTQTIINLR